MSGTRICCFHSPKPSKCSKCKVSFLVLLFRSSKRGTPTWRIQDLPHFAFGICTHTGAYRDRQSGGTDLALAELGASECPLFSTCFTLQNKVPAPIKQGHLASRYITVVHDMCINICSRWVCLPWLTDVLMVHYCVKQIRNSTLALYSNLLKMFYQVNFTWHVSYFWHAL